MAKVTFVSPKGLTKYTHLTEPDTVGQYATGKYTTKLVATPEASKPLMDKIMKEASSHKAGANCKLPFKKETVKEGDATKETGMIQWSFSSKFPPALHDPKNKEIVPGTLVKGFRIGNGSEVRVAGEVYAYEKGISLQLRQVQLLNIVSNKSMFEPDEDGTFDGSDYMDDDEGSGSFTESNVNAMGI